MAAVSSRRCATAAAGTREPALGRLPGAEPVCREFAERFAEMHGARYGLCVANGTIALVAALQAAGIGFGDEVIVPAYTWDGTATAVLFAGGVPVFADVDPDTYCLDVECGARRRSRRAPARSCPSTWPCVSRTWTALLELAREHDLKIIEDCAHVHGGQYCGKGAGSMGDLGCFSFQESKLMTAGEGGIVITSDLRVLRASAVAGELRPRQPDGSISSSACSGSNYRMTELQAALLIGQLEMLPEFAAEAVARGGAG